FESLRPLQFPSSLRFQNPGFVRDFCFSGPVNSLAPECREQTPKYTQIRPVFYWPARNTP
ncbi:hypothetical protein, partial [Brucella melitensis]